MSIKIHKSKGEEKQLDRNMAKQTKNQDTEDTRRPVSRKRRPGFSIHKENANKTTGCPVTAIKLAKIILMLIEARTELSNRHCCGNCDFD